MGGNDSLCCQWTDWPGEKWWKRKWKREGEAGGVWHYSITIRAVLDFPTFQNKETNFSQSPSESLRKNHIIFFETAQEPVPFTCPLFKESFIKLSTVEFYYLSYAFLNIKLNSKKMYYFFLLHFSTRKIKYMRGVCICTIICIMLLYCVLMYYPSIIRIMVKMWMLLL